MSNRCTCLNGAAVTRAFDVGFADAGLTTGETLYTPVVGEILIDAWVEFTVAFNGTTPLLDIGTFLAGNNGWYHGGKGVLVATAQDVGTGGPLGDASPITGSSTTTSRLSDSLGGADPSSVKRALPAKFTTTDPVQVVVTQTGAKGGTATGATAGKAVVYLQTSEPCRCDHLN